MGVGDSPMRAQPAPRHPGAADTGPQPSDWARRIAARPCWISLVLAAVTVLVYYPVASFPFINLDDPDYVTANPPVQAGLTSFGLKWALGTGHAANWHPLTWLSHMLDCQLWGLHAAGPHLTNLLLHVATTILLFRLFRQLTGAVWLSAFVAALFALHPMHVESVAWVSERKDVLSALFFVLTLLAYSAHATRPAARDPRPPPQASRFTFPVSLAYLLSLLFFTLGLMSKPMLVTLPFVLLLLDYWPLDRMKKAEARMKNADTGRFSPFIIHHSSFIILEKLPFLALAAGSCVVTFLVQHSSGAVMQSSELSPAARVANALVSYVRYLGKLLWPANLACFYPRPEHWPMWQIIGAALILIAITIFVLRLMTRRRYLAVGWFWYLGMLVPVIGLVQVGDQAIADRYTYLPSIGLFVIVAWGLADLVLLRPSLKPILAAMAVLALAGLSVATRQQLLYWRSSDNLFRHAMAATQDNAWVHCLLADALVEAGKVDEAEAQSLEALRLKPGFPEVQVLYAKVLTRGRKLDQAAVVLSDVVRQNPGDGAAQSALGAVLGQKGEFPAAVHHLREALKLRPDQAEIRFNLASALEQQGDTAEAINEYRQGLRSQPESPEALNNLAWILATHSNPSLRNGQEAAGLSLRACELTRYERPMFVGTLAAAYAEAGRFAEAVAAAEKARDLALAANQKPLADRNQELLELYKSHQAYHEPGTPSSTQPSR
jgi:protein O-mannosyl-transferase